MLPYNAVGTGDMFVLALVLMYVSILCGIYLHGLGKHVGLEIS